MQNKKNNILNIYYFLKNQKLNESNLKKLNFTNDDLINFTENLIKKFPLTDNNLKILDTILKYFNNYDLIIKKKKTIFMYFVKYKDYKTVEYLLINGANVNFNYNNINVWYYYFNNDKEDFSMLNLLLYYKLKVDYLDKINNTPLIWSIIKGFIFTFELLVKNSLDLINHQNNYGNTALHFACKYNNYYMVKILMNYNANINIVNNLNKFPIDLTYNIKIKNKLKSVTDKNGLKIKNQILYTYNFEFLSYLSHYSDDVKSISKEEENNNLFRSISHPANIEKLHFNDNLNDNEFNLKKIKNKTKILNFNYYSWKENLSNLKLTLKYINKKYFKILQKLKNKNFNFYRNFKLNYNINYLNIEERFNLEIEHYDKYINELNKDYEIKDLKLIKYIKDVVNKYNDKLEIIVYGSFITKLNLPFSDIDICIKNNNENNNKILIDLEKLFKDYCTPKLIIKTDVPILKLYAKNKYNNRKIDISIYKEFINYEENIILVKNYLNEYKHLKIWVRLWKEILFINNFNDPFYGGLGSFSVVLIIITFFQYYEFDNKKSLNDSIFKIFKSFLEFIKDFNNEEFIMNPNKERNFDINPIKKRIINEFTDDIFIIKNPLFQNKNVSKRSFKFLQIKFILNIIYINIFQIDKDHMTSIMNYDKIKNYRYKFQLNCEDSYNLNIKNYYFINKFIFRKIKFN